MKFTGLGVAWFLLLGTTAAGGDGVRGAPNRLARESRPYLRLLACNPVDWYPWGDEAWKGEPSGGRA